MTAIPADAQELDSDAPNLRPGRRAVQTSTRTAASQTNSPPARLTLPPLPSGVVDLDLDEIFTKPIGPRGLEFTAKATALDGKKVRVRGFMVKQGTGTPGLFLLSPVPTSTHESHYGLADDLPANTVHVFVPTMKFQFIPYSPEPMLLTGTLSVGNREEASGRYSTVRLTLDPPTPPKKPKQSAAAEPSGR